MAERKHSALRLGAGTLMAFAIGSLCLTTTTPACAVHNCDGTFAVYSGGRMVGPDEWESNAIGEPWLDYPGLRDWLIHMGPQVGEREIFSIEADLSTDPNPGANNLSNWAPGSGNVVEVRGRVGDSFIIHNDTCGQYSLRVHVLLVPLPAGTLDGGVADAAVADARPVDATSD